MMEDFAAQPFTEHLTREACGLPARKRSTCSAPPLRTLVDPDNQDADVEKSKLLWNVVDAIREACLSKGQNAVIENGLPPERPTSMDRETMWKALFDEGMLIPSDNDSSNLKEHAVPADKTLKPPGRHASIRSWSCWPDKDHLRRSSHRVAQNVRFCLP